MLLLAARQLLLRLILRSHAERRGVSKGEAATAATLDASRRAFGAPQHEGWERAPVWKCFFFSIFALVTSALAAHAQSFADLAKSSGTPQIPGLKIVYLSPLGNPAAATRIRHILVHQTEGGVGSAKNGAAAQNKNPTRRGVMIWVETDGTVYFAVPETVVTLQGDGANRNDNKYVDNSKTFRIVVKENTVGVEFAGNFPDVTKGATPEQAKI